MGALHATRGWNCRPNELGIAPIIAACSGASPANAKVSPSKSSVETSWQVASANNRSTPEWLDSKPRSTTSAIDGPRRPTRATKQRPFS